eukprot:Gb_17863 [translate_table: standard]
MSHINWKLHSRLVGQEEALNQSETSGRHLEAINERAQLINTPAQERPENNIDQRQVRPRVEGEIVEVEGGHIIRSIGRKDRHSKVYTAKGPRDRRVRLSALTAIQFYDVQDRLGYDRPSKAVDWLIKKAKSAIDELQQLDPGNKIPTTSSTLQQTTTQNLMFKTEDAANEMQAALGSGSKFQESRAMARERARERVKERNNSIGEKDENIISSKVQHQAAENINFYQPNFLQTTLQENNASECYSRSQSSLNTVPMQIDAFQSYTNLPIVNQDLCLSLQRQQPALMHSSFLSNPTEMFRPLSHRLPNQTSIPASEIFDPQSTQFSGFGGAHNYSSIAQSDILASGHRQQYNFFNNSGFEPQTSSIFNPVRGTLPAINTFPARARSLPLMPLIDHGVSQHQTCIQDQTTTAFEHAFPATIHGFDGTDQDVKPTSSHE